MLPHEVPNSGAPDEATFPAAGTGNASNPLQQSGALAGPDQLLDKKA